MIFGVQYERYPNPRQVDWEADMKKIRAMGFKIIRTWMYWKRVNPADGIWDFSYYDGLFDVAGACGLKVQIQLFLEAPPEFLAREHPEWRYSNADSEYERLVRRGAQQIGGFQGFDCCNPEPRARAEEYIRQVALHYRNRPELFGYDVWNELWMSQWLDSSWTAPRRVAFLQGKYGSLEALNIAHVAVYRSFEEAKDPREPSFFGTKRILAETYADNMDALEFENFLAAELLRWRADTLRACDNTHPVMAHIGGGGGENPLAKNSWEYSPAVDAWGVSEHADTLESFFLSMQGCRDAAAGKPWWLAEDGSGAAGYGPDASARSPEFLLSTVAMAMMFGAQGLMFWQYRPEISGMESPNYGLVKLDGGDSVRSRAVAEVVSRLSGLWELPNSPCHGDTPVAIAYSPAAGILDRVEPCGLHQSFSGWDMAFSRCGAVPLIVRDTDLAEGVPNGIRLLVLPMEIVEIPGLRESLLDWVRRGGVLAASGRTFLYDGSMLAQREYPGVEMFGVNENEACEYTGDILMFGDTEDSIIPSGGRRIGMELRGAKPIGAAGREPAVSEMRLGKGKCIWFGCDPGREHGKKSIAGLTGAASMLLKRAGITPEAYATGGIVANLSKKGERRVLFAVNLSKESICSWILLNRGTTEKAMDIFSGAMAYEGVETDRFPMQFLPEQSKVLLLD